ncbi:kinesin motor domain protein, partial [Ancylostoma caninum]
LQRFFQVTIGTDRSFTYDHVFDQATQQHEIYDSCIEKLTGSGKTYTMGTAFDAGAISEHEVGVIPRALAHVFRRIIELRREAQENGILEPTFDVSVQFIELYNEEIIDLLANDRASSFNVRIHEDARGEIYLHGVTNKGVHDLHSVVANQDKSSKLIGELRGRIAALEAELLEFKQGRRTIDSDGVETVNDQYHENVMLTAEINQLRFRVKALQETNEILRNRNVDLMAKASGTNGFLGNSQANDENGASSDGKSVTVHFNSAVDRMMDL